MLNEYKERKLAEFQEQVDELRSDMDFNKYGDTVIHKFGYKTKCEKEEPETPEIFVITDFGNIKQFISDLIDEISKSIPKEKKCFHLPDCLTLVCSKCGKKNAQYGEECELNDKSIGGNDCRETLINNLTK